MSKIDRPGKEAWAVRELARGRSAASICSEDPALLARLLDGLQAVRAFLRFDGEPWPEHDNDEAEAAQDALATAALGALCDQLGHSRTTQGAKTWYCEDCWRVDRSHD